jgi:RNA polymerase sigma-70 factor (family 1)
MTNDEFNKIFHEYYNKLCAFAYHYIHDNQATEDIVQDVFCNLIENHDKIRLETLSTYLFQCTHNRAIDYVRNANNQQNEIDSVSELEQYFSEMVINQTEDNYDYQVLLKAVYGIIDTFPAKTKEVFMMSRKNNMSNKEIASQLGITVKAVEKHITKALSILRKILIEDKLITFFLLLLYFIN